MQVGNNSWTEQIATGTIKDITKDDQGNLWVATAGDGVYVRHGATTLQHYTTSNSGLSSDNVWDIIEDAQHNMWFFTP